ncbi:MAG: fimbrillin family protein [Prevotella sp.]|nr:fimbrillin family protein [Prevotella sp.]
MKTRIFSYIAAFGLAIALNGCSNDDYLGGHYTTDGAGVEINVVSANKSWDQGLHIGISNTYGFSDATTRNRDFIVSEDGKTLTPYSATPFYVKGTASILAYYPFIGEDGAEPSLVLNSYTEEGEELTDFFLAKADNVTKESAKQVNLNFYPTLSTLTVTINIPAGENVTKYVVSGLARRGRIDPYELTITGEDVIDYSATGNNISNFTLTVIPQTLAEGEMTLTLKGVKRIYNISMPALTIEPNSVCEATVNLQDGSVTYEFVNNGSIWTDSGLGFDSTVPQYDVNPEAVPWGDSGLGNK